MAYNRKCSLCKEEKRQNEMIPFLIFDPSTMNVLCSYICRIDYLKLDRIMRSVRIDKDTQQEVLTKWGLQIDQNVG